MARKVDITERLSFEGNPPLVIKGRVIEVNTGAPTILKVMNLMFSDDPGIQDIMDVYDMIFSGKSKTELEKLKLDPRDLIIVAQEAVQFIFGAEEPAGGEQ